MTLNDYFEVPTVGCVFVGHRCIEQELISLKNGPRNFQGKENQCVSQHKDLVMSVLVMSNYYDTPALFKEKHLNIVPVIREIDLCLLRRKKKHISE